MKIFTVSWEAKSSYWTKVEAESEEEALALVKVGRYDDVDSEPIYGSERKFTVEEGERGQGFVTRHS